MACLVRSHLRMLQPSTASMPSGWLLTWSMERPWWERCWRPERRCCARARRACCSIWTSSSVIAGGALTGLGFGPKDVSRVVGVAKAYTTRVGAGPFPTELLDETGDRLRGTGANPWDEYGTTTGRPRRCGWLDLVILRYAARINGLDELAIVKLDVLSGLEQLKVAVAYERDGDRIAHFPAEFGLEELAKWQPVYEQVPGWIEDIMGVREFDDLPAAAQDYVTLIEEQVGVPITSISVGPERDQMIVR
jgi:adenylosuccinate synthase